MSEVPLYIGPRRAHPHPGPHSLWEAFSARRSRLRIVWSRGRAIYAPCGHADGPSTRCGGCSAAGGAECATHLLLQGEERLF